LPRPPWHNQKHVDLNLAEVLALAVEDFDAGIAAVRHVDIPLRIGCNSVGV